MDAKQALWRGYILIPEGLRHRIDARRRLPYWRQAGAIFVHVPKAAGTSVSQALYGRPLDHLRAREIRSVCPGDFQRLFTFSLVRNPWARTLSAYRFACSGGTAVAGIRDAQRYQGPAFRSFEAFLEEWLVHQDLQRIDKVFRPQGYFLMDAAGQVMVEHVGRVEAMQETVAVLQRRLGRQLDIPRMNALSHGQDFRAAYRNPGCIEHVARLYREDIVNFGYQNTF